MALSSFKPCSRVMHNSPHQTDQQQKEAFYLLRDREQQHQEDEDEDEDKEGEQEEAEAEEASRKVHAPANRKAFPQEPLSMSEACNPCCKENLPTFIAHQGFATLRLQKKKECTSDTGHIASRWFKKEQQQKDQLLCPLFQKNSQSQSFLHVPPEIPRRIQKLRFMGRDSSKHSVQQDHHRKQNKQRTDHNKNACISGNDIHGLATERGMSAREELGLEKRRNSSAAVEDVFRFREVMKSKERSYDGRSSWEEEVRQAMARGLIHTKQNEEPLGLQRSVSVKDHGISVLPSTLLVKKTGLISNNGDCLDAAGPKPNKMGGHLIQNMNAIEAGMWSGLNVKSPSEERWEEAAEVEEWQELQRRARSQSMRYDTLRSAELTGLGKQWDTRSTGSATHNDEEWAVYKKSGCVNMRQHVSDGNFVAPLCCRSLLGRSLSMRDTRMGLVMECAACGAALHGAGGQLLCFCSCCASNRVSSAQGGMGTTGKKKNGILRACRKLLGLGKKRPMDTER